MLDTQFHRKEINDFEATKFESVIQFLVDLTDKIESEDNKASSYKWIQ
jgi:hypothetical protein